MPHQQHRVTSGSIDITITIVLDHFPKTGLAASKTLFPDQEKTTTSYQVETQVTKSQIIKADLVTVHHVLNMKDHPRKWVLESPSFF